MADGDLGTRKTLIWQIVLGVIIGAGGTVLGAFILWTLTQTRDKLAENERTQIANLLMADDQFHQQLVTLLRSKHEEQLKLAEEQIRSLDRMPVGTILTIAIQGTEEEIYKLVPRFWVLCDGKKLNGSHPKAFSSSELGDAWNTTVPDLRSTLIGGAPKPTDAREIWAQGKLELPSLDVDNSDATFTMEDNPASDGEVSAKSLVQPNFHVTPGHEYHLNQPGVGEVAVAIVAHKIPTKISDANTKTTEIDLNAALPRHYRCNFLIRVK